MYWQRGRDIRIFVHCWCSFCGSMVPYNETIIKPSNSTPSQQCPQNCKQELMQILECQYLGNNTQHSLKVETTQVSINR